MVVGQNSRPARGKHFAHCLQRPLAGHGDSPKARLAVLARRDDLDAAGQSIAHGAEICPRPVRPQALFRAALFKLTHYLRLSKTDIAEEMREEHRRQVVGDQ
jgi:hypothetical protein